jgi:hypothetical protein
MELQAVKYHLKEETLTAWRRCMLRRSTARMPVVQPTTADHGTAWRVAPKKAHTTR